MRPIFRPLAGLALCLAALQEPAAETFTGPVVTIFDGDTVEVLVDQRPRRVRLEGIDAPEKAQPFGARAKQRLADLAGGQVVTVESGKVDKYGRTVGRLTLNGQDVNLAMVADGLAWWYRKYSSEQPRTDQVLYEAAETRAKAERRGLWRDPDPLPPWEWRHRPPPAEGYAAACPCASSAVCTGPKGGRFCIREDGSKRYVHAE